LRLLAPGLNQKQTGELLHRPQVVWMRRRQLTRRPLGQCKPARPLGHANEPKTGLHPFGHGARCRDPALPREQEVVAQLGGLGVMAPSRPILGSGAEVIL
jgi:hypothetical protein